MAKSEDKPAPPPAPTTTGPTAAETAGAASATLQATGTKELFDRAAQNALPRVGILDLVKEQETREAEPAKYTFGAWVRAKGVSLDKVREAVKAGKVTGSGDGDMMTEKEFDEAVGFQITSQLTNLPIVMQHHVAGDQISEGREGRTKREV